MINNNKYEYSFQIMVLGDSKVGKSSIYSRYSKDIFNDKYSKSGLIFKINRDVIEYICSLDWYEYEEANKPIEPSYYLSIHGMVFVYDITNVESFNSIKGYWYDDYKKYRLDINRDSKKLNIKYGYDYKEFVLNIKSTYLKANGKTCNEWYQDHIKKSSKCIIN